MRHRLGVALVAACTLSACQLAVAPPGAAPAAEGERARAGAARAAASPAAAATGRPPATPAIGEPATPGPGPVLLAGDGPALRGHLRVDASYMVGAGRGALVGRMGLPPASLAEATAVLAGDAPLVGEGAGNAIADARPGADGTTLVGNSGNTLIGQDGGSFVGQPQALVGNSGNTYRLAQAGTPPRVEDTAPPAMTGPALPIGTELPAAGMLVAAVSLATGKYLPVGRGPDGRPVYAAFTDAAGGFTIHPPADTQGNMRVVALAAGSGDGRLTYQLVTAAAAELAMGEDSDDATDYVRLCFRDVLDGMLRRETVTQVEREVESGLFGTKGSDEARLGIGRLEKLAERLGYAGWARDEDRVALRQRIVDMVLAELDLPAVRMLDGRRTATGALTASLGKTREDARAYLAADPAALTRGLAALTQAGYTLKRPSDVNDYIVKVVMARDPFNVSEIVAKITALRAEMGIPDNDMERVSDVAEASFQLCNAVGNRFFAPAPAGGKSLLDAVEADAVAFAEARSLGPAKR